MSCTVIRLYMVRMIHFLRTWEQRWYLVAEPDNHHHGQSVFALERMDNIRLTEGKMFPSKKITADEYFDGSFGVNHSDDQKPERILIKVYSTQAEYVNALPIHESQKEIEKTDEWSIFEYRLVPCFNFYQKSFQSYEKKRKRQSIMANSFADCGKFAIFVPLMTT